jgi:hypothetical protein
LPATTTTARRVAAQRAQCPYRDLLGLRIRRHAVMQITGHDDEIWLMGLGDVDDLLQYRQLFVHSGLSLEDLSEVPVRCVQ